jgi:hypothetical protein
VKRHDPLAALVRVLAQVAVEEFLDETQNKLLQEEETYETNEEE